jgi:hypothetical protein
MFPCAGATTGRAPAARIPQCLVLDLLPAPRALQGPGRFLPVSICSPLAIRLRMEMDSQATIWAKLLRSQAGFHSSDAAISALPERSHRTIGTPRWPLSTTRLIGSSKSGRLHRLRSLHVLQRSNATHRALAGPSTASRTTTRLPIRTFPTGPQNGR